MLDFQRPNLFIIGAMKSATTSLHAYLGSHPSIFMSDPKEPSYFVDRAELSAVHPIMERKGFWRGEEFYLSLFKDAKYASTIGESSTAYTKLPRTTGVPCRIWEFNPDARLIYIMRDPVERTMSHYWHEVRWLNEERDLVTAIREEPFYREVSNYAMQLAPYLELFDKSRIIILTYEELNANPLKVIQGIYKWLGQETSFVPDTLRQRMNETPREVNFVRGRGVLHRFRYSRFWNAVGPRVPPLVRSLGRKFSERTVARESVPRAEVVDFLRPIHRSETRELSEMLGRAFPEWKTLYGTADSSRGFR